ELLHSLQSERNRQGFRFRPHQRRQLKAWTQPISAVASPLSLDRNAKILQHSNITAGTACIDLQALRQFARGNAWTSLKQIKHGQETRHGRIHRTIFPSKNAQIGPILATFYLILLS